MISPVTSLICYRSGQFKFCIQKQMGVNSKRVNLIFHGKLNFHKELNFENIQLTFEFDFQYLF